jgi:hypothetical protein
MFGDYDKFEVIWKERVITWKDQEKSWKALARIDDIQIDYDALCSKKG